MPTHCCVPLCKNTKKLNPTLTFHRFPPDEKKCNKWIKLIRSKNFEWTMNKVICSWHFPNGRLVDGEPKRFHWNQHKNFSLNGMSLDDLTIRKPRKQMDSARDRGNSRCSSSTVIEEEAGLKSNCLFCRRKPVFIRESTPSSGSASSRNSAMEKWMMRCAKSICEELHLDTSCQSWFTSGTFCPDCQEMLCDINAIKASILSLQLKLGKIVARAKGMLVENFAQVIREDAIKRSTMPTAYSGAIKCIGIQLQSVKREDSGIEIENLKYELEPADYHQVENELASEPPPTPATTVSSVRASSSSTASASVSVKPRDQHRAALQRVATDHSYTLTPINPKTLRMKRVSHRRLTSRVSFLEVVDQVRTQLTPAIQPTERRQVFNIKQGPMSFSFVPVPAEPDPVVVTKCTFCELKFTNWNQANIHAQLHNIFYNSVLQPSASASAVSNLEPETLKLPKKWLAQKQKVSKPPRQVPCPKCSLTFKTGKDMRIHKAEEHLPPKNPMCEHCGFQSKTYSQFKRHLALHTKEFMCGEKDCGKAFRDKYALSYHTLSCHSTDVPPRYTCTICNKGFYVNYKFKQHMECHGEERKYKCHLCPQAFKNSSCLWVHVNINHKRNPNGLTSKRSRPRKGRLPTAPPPPPPPSATALGPPWAVPVPAGSVTQEEAPASSLKSILNDKLIPGK